jgi:hypothetical protein
MSAEDAIDFLRREVAKILSEFSRGVLAKNPGLFSTSATNSNEFFSLRAYVGFMWDRYEDEVVIAVDVPRLEESIRVDSDICLGDGRIIADGPVVDCRFPLDSAEFARISAWTTSFSQFLTENESVLQAAIEGMRKAQ